MPNNQETETKSAAKRLTNVIFLIDTSGSMNEEGKIDSLNNAMNEACPIVRRFAGASLAAKVQCSVLEFNDDTNWRFEQVDAEDLEWIDLTAWGGTSLGAAYRTLASKLTRSEGGFMAQHLNNAPIIILITDGYPTDDSSAGLSILKKNRWFKNAIKIAIEITGSDVDRKQLIDFTGSKERVISIASDGLEKVLKNMVIDTLTHTQDVENHVKNTTDGDDNDTHKELSAHEDSIAEPTHTSTSIDLEDFDF